VAKQFTLGRNERLKSRKEIEQLFRGGKTISVFPLMVYYLFSPARNPKSPTRSSQPALQFGVGVSAKHFKKAVQRNTIKRLIREAYRLQKNELQNALTTHNGNVKLFFVYTARELAGFSAIKEKVNVILNKLIEITNENSAADS
jgi:ribonuclease P protein component